MKKTIRVMDLNNKKVIVRCDFNVPLDDAGEITDDTRIRAALPTIQYLLDHGAGIILMSHLGRPKGEPNPKYSLKVVAEYLEELLGREVEFMDVDEVIDDSADNVENGLWQPIPATPLVAAIESFVFTDPRIKTNLPFVISAGFILPPGLFLRVC